ncbi:MAG: cell division protein FtsH, partial [Burkholderiaceae bacterium]|nr:cell division protein FtsH [Burkholderiaceae bacterium]
DDLARVTDIARDMVTRFGMDERLGYIAFEQQRPRFLDVPAPQPANGNALSEATREKIDAAVREIVMTAFEKALAILAANRDVLEASARELLARETLDEAALDRLMGNVKPPAEAPRREPVAAVA